MEKKFTTENFEAKVLKSEKPVLGDFYADWCGPCKMMAPVLEEVAQERNDLLFGKVNVDEEATAAQKYGISSVPTVLIFRGGKQSGQIVGLVGKSKVQSALREAGL